MIRLILAILISTSCAVYAANEVEALAGFDHSHALWTTILGKHVANGKVNYRALRGSRAELDTYANQLSTVNQADYKSWSREQKLAYWINAYNVFAIRTILNNYPIQAGQTLKGHFYPDNSIQQIPGVWDDIKHQTPEGAISLNHIEHEILRKELKEPRIHFCIVCASIGCPQLWDRGFDAAKLDAQLEAAASRFVRNRVNVKVDLNDETIYLSKILKWFREDFDRFARLDRYGKYDGVISFCMKHMPKPIQRQLPNLKLDIEWYAYDWTLNEQ